jgi:hypothetical protein
MSIRSRLTQLLILLIIALAAIGRTVAYGDLRLAVATNDTLSYVISSDAPLFSTGFFSGQRLPTTNLIYRIFRPARGYIDFVTANTTERQILAGYENIALFQVILSILGWGALAYVISTKVNHVLLKLIACATILLLGFSPQTADWDSVMGSESLSFSLFALAFAFLVMFVFWVYEDQVEGFGTSLIGVVFCIVYMFWAYTRDSNNFSAIITTAMVGGTLFIKKYRDLKILRTMTIFLGLVNLFGVTSAVQSTRSATPMRNVYDVHVLPFSARIEFMKTIGMPEPYTPEYHEWAENHASKAYMVFLVTHPRYTINSYLRGAQAAFTDYIQPYFRTSKNDWRLRLMPVGQVVNMGFVAFILDILLMLTFWNMAIQRGSDSAGPWIWLATWLFLTAACALFFSVIGDNIGLNRHTLFPVAAFRLFFWIFLLVTLDLLLSKGRESATYWR